MFFNRYEIWSGNIKNIVKVGTTKYTMKWERLLIISNKQFVPDEESCERESLFFKSILGTSIVYSILTKEI